MKFKNWKIKTKIASSAIFSLLIVVIIITTIASNQSEVALEKKSFEELRAVKSLKVMQLEDFFAKSVNDVNYTAKSKIVETGVKKLINYHKEMKVNDSGKFITTGNLENLTYSYNEIYNEIDFYLKDYVETFKYYDIFLICKKHGHVMYTHEQEADLGSNLSNGPYKDSNLANLWRKVVKTKDVYITDMKPYAPSNNEPALFIGAPVYIEGEFLSVLALQVSLEALNEIMLTRSGMGKTGETYLVGQDNLMRSKLFNDTEMRNVKKSLNGNVEKNGVNTFGTKQALAGTSGESVYMNYNGREVLGSYMPIDFMDKTWALIAEIEMSEVDKPIGKLIVNIIIAAIIVTLIFIFFSYYIAGTISNPIKKQLVPALERMKNNDFSTTLDYKILEREDEIGTIAKGYNSAQNSITNLLNILRKNIQIIVESVEELSSTSNQMASGAHELSSQVETVSSTSEEISTNSQTIASSSEQASTSVATVASASEQMSANSDSVASATEQASTNLNSLIEAINNISEDFQKITENSNDVANSVNTSATAIEEMSSSLSEVAKNTGQANQISENAAKESNKASEVMNNLSNASKQISKIVNVINDIADQTNMLALNATIEAASAGDAGKGFAVVANEVKELAKQTGEATDRIGSQITEMQKATDDAVKSIGSVSDIITELKDISSTIASSVEEQTSTMNEISNSVALAANKSSDMERSSQSISREIENVNRNADEAGEGMQEISKNIQELALAAQEVSRNSGEAANGVDDIARNTEEITTAIDNITRNIVNVNTVATENANGAERVRKYSKKLSELSEELNELSEKFIL